MSPKANLWKLLETSKYDCSAVIYCACCSSDAMRESCADRAGPVGAPISTAG